MRRDPQGDQPPPPTTAATDWRRCQEIRRPHPRNHRIQMALWSLSDLDKGGRGSRDKRGDWGSWGESREKDGQESGMEGREGSVGRSCEAVGGWDGLLGQGYPRSSRRMPLSLYTDTPRSLSRTSTCIGAQSPQRPPLAPPGRTWVWLSAVWFLAGGCQASSWVWDLSIFLACKWPKDSSCWDPKP